jgi:hypothetical protein
MTPNLPATRGSLDRELVKRIAFEIGKEVAAHIEIMYPNAVEATSKNMLLSVRNCTHNNIMAALKYTDAESIERWIKTREKHRRKLRAIYKRMRAKK